MKMKHIAQAAFALVATVAANSAMAVNATAILDTALLTANSLTVSALGVASFSSTTGALTINSTATSTSTLADFALADGFKVQTSFGPLNFTDFQFNSAGLLTGKLQGTGLILGGVSFTGSLLQASTLTNVAGVLQATNFTASPALSSYLQNDVGLSTTTVAALGGMLLSMTTPGLVAPVPEPSTYALMGLGLVGISLVARRRQA